MIYCVGNGGHAKALELHPVTRKVELGPDDPIPFESGSEIIVGIGAPDRAGIKTRREVIERLIGHSMTKVLNYGFPTHRTDGRRLFRDGMGIQILSGVHIGPGCALGRFAIINTRAVLEHDVRVGEFTHIAPGAIILGSAKIGNSCLIGAGAIVLPGIKIAEDTVVGAGAVVTSDVMVSGLTLTGMPAKHRIEIRIEGTIIKIDPSLDIADIVEGGGA